MLQKVTSKQTFEQKVKEIEKKYSEEEQKMSLDLPKLVQSFEQNEKKLYSCSSMRRTELFINNMKAINDLKRKQNEIKQNQNFKKDDSPRFSGMIIPKRI